MIEFTAFRKVPFIFGLPDIPHKLNYVALGPEGVNPEGALRRPYKELKLMC
jgi:hypothetical protein